MNTCGPRLAARGGLVADALADVYSCLVPSLCLGCGGLDGPLCPGCRAGCREDLQPRPRDAAESARLLPLVEGHSLPEAWSGGDYTGLRARLMLAYKAGGARCLAGDLAPFLCSALRGLDLGPGDVLLPIPTTRRSYLRRGFDPVSLLLKHCRAEDSMPGVRLAGILIPREPLLSGVPGLSALAGEQGSRRRTGQKGLGVRGRARRTESAFRLRDSGGLLQDTGVDRIVVVDDVLTTGATAGAAMRVLRNAGFGGELACAVALSARAPRGRPERRESGESLMKADAGESRREF